ncbi:hypothetical protein DPSP01_012088 [Paraphaeosphaeria sporulosa]
MQLGEKRGKKATKHKSKGNGNGKKIYKRMQVSTAATGSKSCEITETTETANYKALVKAARKKHQTVHIAQAYMLAMTSKTGIHAGAQSGRLRGRIVYVSNFDKTSPPNIASISTDGRTYGNHSEGLLQIKPPI